MLKFRINTKEAVLFEAPVPKPVVESNKPEEGSLFSKLKSLARIKALSTNCFFGVLDCLVPSSISEISTTLSTEKIIIKIQEKYEPYLWCRNVLIQSLRAGQISQVQLMSIDEFQSLLKFILNVDNEERLFGQNIQMLNAEGCNQYITRFVQHVNEINDDSKKRSSEWLQLAINHSDNMIDYALYQACAELLKEMNVSEKDVLAEQEALLSIHFKIKLDKHPTILHNFLQRKLASNYGFKIDTSWNPNMPLDELRKCIKIHGPLIAGGYFGKQFYSKPPVLKKIGELEVFAWEKLTFSRVENIGHTAVIIGASKVGYMGTTQDLVYFIDPIVDKNSANYPLYMMSYKAFCECLGSTHSHDVFMLQEEGKQLDEFTYFFYHPQLAPKAQANFWATHAPSCKTVTPVLAAVGAAAVAAGLILSKTL
ncbi:MAG: hypothetical protein WBE18_08040 [Gammaproteobacteria bacterium]